MDMDSTEALVETHPRDKLLVIRQNMLMRKKKTRRLIKASKQASKLKSGREICDKILSRFSEHYLGCDNTNFSPMEKKELIKLCVSYCRKWLAVTASPIIATLGGIIGASLLIRPENLFLLFPWLVFSLVYVLILLKYQLNHYITNLIDCIEFFWHRRSLSEDNQKNLD